MYQKRKYPTEGYSIEDWNRLYRAVEDHRPILWQNVAVYASVVIISVAFWLGIIFGVILPLMQIWSGG